MISLLMNPESISGLAHFLTDVARERKTLKMICLNVPPHIASFPLLSTNLANMSFVSPAGDKMLTQLRHGIDLCIKLHQIFGKV